MNRTPQVKMIENEQEQQKTSPSPQEKGEKRYTQVQNTGKKPYFVTPWPEGKTYTVKNSNTLTKEIESHFANCCNSCGNSSHIARQCKTYPETRVILTLCTVCHQGFHEQSNFNSNHSYSNYSDSNSNHFNSNTNHFISNSDHSHSNYYNSTSTSHYSF